MPKSTLMSAAELEEQFIQKGGTSPTLNVEPATPLETAEQEDTDAIHRFTLRLPKNQKKAIDQAISKDPILKRLGATHYILTAIEEKLARESTSKPK
ncbi:hypothetical protein [Siphonobacter sp. SORGH_AS_1065]|uniref:hypothetical protein n=1 Tax=Siphonobacter sp. SORGH_AS_1065 TaxID=3041795 RepID=UPI0027D917A8|nr:hypothetical protein [Siphonobacter sp. SORGH_AS_1065]